MFETFTGSQKARAKADFKAAEAMHRVLKGQGKPDSEIRAILENMLAGKPWKDEVLAAIFIQRQESRQERQRQYYENRQERQRQEWRDWYNSNDNYYRNRSYSPPPPRVSLEEALKFFGFDSLPDADSLKRRYRELALKLHPDKGGTHETFVLFQDYKDLLYRKLGL